MSPPSRRPRAPRCMCAGAPFRCPCHSRRIALWKTSPDCPGCNGPTILFSKRADGSVRFVCASEGFGASCMGEVIVRVDGSELIGGDGFV